MGDRHAASRYPRRAKPASPSDGHKIYKVPGEQVYGEVPVPPLLPASTATFVRTLYGLIANIAQHSTSATHTIGSADYRPTTKIAMLLAFRDRQRGWSFTSFYTPGITPATHDVIKIFVGRLAVPHR